MRLSTLRLLNFRNHVDTSLDFGDGTNLLLGENGQGKTNVIEAIAYLCLTKSFYASSDALAVHFGREMFEVEGSFVFAGGTPQNVRVAFSAAGGEKVFMINRKRIEPFSSVIGRYPIVICSPEHAPITSGPPAERRRFLDFVISQADSPYLQNLLEYRKVLRHRNKVLLDARIARRDAAELLDPWTDQLVRLAVPIMMTRAAFVDAFARFIASSYHHVVGSEEEPTIGYEPSVPLPDSASAATVEEALRTELAAQAAAELRTGTSLVGPHRDELVFRINGLDLRKFASQGQHKTYLVALKIGEFFYLQERRGETPILLLDDIFSELDDRRSAALLEYVGALSQTFVTSTNPALMEGRTEGRDRRWTIEGGRVAEHQATV